MDDWENPIWAALQVARGRKPEDDTAPMPAYGDVPGDKEVLKIRNAMMATNPAAALGRTAIMEGGKALWDVYGGHDKLEGAKSAMRDYFYPPSYQTAPLRKGLADGGLSDPTLPIPSMDDIRHALGIAKQIATPPDPYEEAGRMVQQARQGDYLGALETGYGAMPMTGAITPGPGFRGARLPSVDNLARQADKFVYHSSTAKELPKIKDYIEPQHGPWVREVAAGAVDDVDEFLDSATPLVWASDKPNWVRSKVWRELNKRPNAVTEDDIRNVGHVALIPRKSESAEHIWRVGPEGLDNGPYSTVTNLRSGQPSKAYDTDLYDSGEPFGVERNEYVSAQDIEPLLHLTGDELVQFLRATGHLNKADGGEVNDLPLMAREHPDLEIDDAMRLAKDYPTNDVWPLPAEANWPAVVDLMRKGMSATAALSALGYSASALANERSGASRGP